MESKANKYGHIRDQRHPVGRMTSMVIVGPLVYMRARRWAAGRPLFDAGSRTLGEGLLSISSVFLWPKAALAFPGIGSLIRRRVFVRCG